MIGLKPMIKWPNDAMLGGKKFAGILTEMSAEVGKLNWVIVGMGINVNNAVPAGLESIAVSLSKAAGRKLCRAELLAVLLSDFYSLYKVFVDKGFSGFMKEYNDRSLLAGTWISIDTGNGIAEGTVDKVDSGGYLWLKTADNKHVKIMAGDIVKSQISKIKIQN